ncbi:hypothetical protein E2C01_010043 [Portunus trituberculatus]|uniref:Ionotropic glutamate receptor C-terminal domain-containing protein n=1 Tax=Portunus trituberculatus TaxID=210409 RepID=A0A5B7D7M9_PORTR|nr:hypothetical protein [Portunus trituberculatus]
MCCFRSDGLDGTTTKRKKLQCDDVFQWFFATFVGQALEFGMQCVLLRLVSGIWMVMVLIVGIVYRSNLKAMMIAPKLRLPFDSMEELVETDIPCLWNTMSLYPFAEISVLGDFNVHHQLWLSSPFTHHPSELAFNFASLHDLEQLVTYPSVTGIYGLKGIFLGVPPISKPNR